MWFLFFELFPYVIVGVLLPQMAHYEAKYQCVTKQSPLSKFSGSCTLLIGSSQARFTFDAYPKRSVAGKDDSGRNYYFIPADFEGLPVWYDIATREVYFKSTYPLRSDTLFVIKDTLASIDWHITERMDTIGGLYCRLATGRFGNRNYKVWFAPEVPLPFGPYKLWGLPGLIVQAQSDDGMVAFYLTRISRIPAGKNVLVTKPVGPVVTMEACRKIIIEDLLRVEARSTEEVQLTNHDPVPDYWIEKNMWTVISDYKSRRKQGEKVPHRQ